MTRIRFTLATAAMVTLMALTAQAQVAGPSLADAKKAIAAAQAVAVKLNVNVSCVVLDARGAMVAAERMDKVGSKGALKEIGMIKVIAPNMLCQVVDWAIQAHGGGGLAEDFGLAEAYARARTLRIVDGPDEVHRNQIAKLELRQYRKPE